jgi:hypothetical protein
VPVPSGAIASAGSDGNIVIINSDSGEEWDMHSFTTDASGNFTAGNVGHYNITWVGVPPYDQYGNPWWLRGSGMTYLAGLVRPCEIAQGHIDHALAIGVPAPASNFVYPATKSDGSGTPGTDLAEGAHLQLDPTISDATIQSWGCTGACFTIAKAVQKYGMYVTDVSGRPKIPVEDDTTANWGTTMAASTVSPIPIADLRVLH